MPVRASHQSLVVASAEDLSEHDRHAVQQVTGLHTVFVRASAGQIEQALSMYYASALPTSVAA